MDGGKLEDIGMCLETSYREIFFESNQGYVRPTEYSIATFGSQNEAGRLKQQFVTLEVLLIQDQYINSAVRLT